MKIKLTILSVVFVVTATACDQKPDIASKTEVVGKEVAKKTQEKVQETVQQLTDKTSQVTKEVVEAGKEGVKKSAPVAMRAKEATEEALSDTIAHAQEITKTQVSKSRQSANSAEEDMMKELESQNKH